MSNVKMCDMCGTIRREEDMIKIQLNCSLFELKGKRPGETAPTKEICPKCYEEDDKVLMKYLKAVGYGERD